MKKSAQVKITPIFYNKQCSNKSCLSEAVGAYQTQRVGAEDFMFSPFCFDHKDETRQAIVDSIKSIPNTNTTLTERKLNVTKL